MNTGTHRAHGAPGPDASFGIDDELTQDPIGEQLGLTYEDSSQNQKEAARREADAAYFAQGQEQGQAEQDQGDDGGGDGGDDSGDDSGDSGDGDDSQPDAPPDVHPGVKAAINATKRGFAKNFAKGFAAPTRARHAPMNRPRVKAAFRRRGNARIRIHGEESSAFPYLAVYGDGTGVVSVGICKTPNGIVPVMCKQSVFGAEQSEKLLMSQASKESVKAAAESIVNRARQGDQNAMAMIAVVRDNRFKNRRAGIAYDFMMKYAQSSNEDAIGTEVAGPEDEYMHVSVALANGPPLSNASIRSVIDQLPTPDEKRAFVEGCIHFRKKVRLGKLKQYLDEIAKKALTVGRAFGIARSIQAVRMPNSRISNYCPNVGWELGE